jgi:hypothetical protein
MALGAVSFLKSSHLGTSGTVTLSTPPLRRIASPSGDPKMRWLKAYSTGLAA